MAIVADLHFFPDHSDHALDIKLVLRQSISPARLEHNDFPAPRPPKIIGHSVYEQMIPTDRFELDDVLPGPEGARVGLAVRVKQTGAFQHIIGREPNGVGFSPNGKALFQIEKQKAFRLRLVARQNTIRLRNEMFEADTVEPETEK